MRNQPKYHFFKNTTYALKGLLDISTTERSFQIELVLAALLIPTLFIVDVSLVEKLLMFITLMGMLLAEAINSAIERVVDLVTKDHHIMAGRAKDVGSTIVFLSIAIFIVTWSTLLLNRYFF